MRIILFCLFLSVAFFTPQILGQSEKKAAYGIIFDNTGSLRPQIATEIELGSEILTAISGKSLVSIFGFVTNPDPKSPNASIAAGIECSSDAIAIKKQIDGLTVIGGQTTLIDAISVVAERLNTSKPSTCGEYTERNLVVITDGEDRASVTKLSDLLASLKTTGTKVYVVGLVNDLGSDGGFIGKSPVKKAKEFLENLTKETGGKVVFPKKKQKPADIIKELFEVNSQIVK